MAGFPKAFGLRRVGHVVKIYDEMRCIDIYAIYDNIRSQQWKSSYFTQEPFPSHSFSLKLF